MPPFPSSSSLDKTSEVRSDGEVPRPETSYRGNC